MDKMTKKILTVFVVVVVAALAIFIGVRAYQQKEAEEKARIETKREMVRKLYALGQMSLETIAECTELPLDEVKALVEKKPA